MALLEGCYLAQSHTQISKSYHDKTIRVAMTSTTKNQLDNIMKHYNMTKPQQVIEALIKREALRIS